MKEVYLIEHFDDDFEWTEDYVFATYNRAEEYLFNNGFEKKIDSHGYKYYEKLDNNRLDYTARIYKKDVLR